MRLTNAEKLMILLLCDIRDGHQEVDTELVRNAIFHDHTWAIRWELNGVNFEDEEDPAYVAVVCDILDMFSYLEASYNALDAAEKARVDAADMAEFRSYRGFDGNNETVYLSCVAFLVEKMGRWTEFADRAHLNSHMRYLPAYERMVEVWTPIRNEVHTDWLTADQIIEIIGAARHPG